MKVTKKWEMRIYTYTLPYVKQMTSEICCVAQGAHSVLCDDLDGWDRGGRLGRRSKREEIYVYIQLILFTIQQKQHCKAITLQQMKKKEITLHSYCS